MRDGPATDTLSLALRITLGVVALLVGGMLVALFVRLTGRDLATTPQLVAVGTPFLILVAVLVVLFAPDS